MAEQLAASSRSASACRASGRRMGNEMGWVCTALDSCAARRAVPALQQEGWSHAGRPTEVPRRHACAQLGGPSLHEYI